MLWLGWNMNKYNEVKEMPHPKQTKGRSQLPGCLASPPPLHPFFFFFLTKLCFVWFMVQYLFQSEFPSIVYQSEQQKLKKSWCFSSWRHIAASHPTVADPSSQKALNRGIKKHFFLKSMCYCFNVLPLWEWVSHDANIYFHIANITVPLKRILHFVAY